MSECLVSWGRGLLVYEDLPDDGVVLVEPWAADDGVVLSDALGWANDGKTYDWILGYFYTGTVLKKIY